MNDVDAAAFLSAHFGDGVSGLRRLQGGEWSTAYALDLDAQPFVARFSRVRADFDKDAAASAFGSAELPVPRVLEVGAAGDGFFALSERLPGQSLDSLSPHGMRAAWPSLLATLDAIRSVSLEHTSGFGRWDATGNAAFASWAGFLLDVKNGPAPVSRITGWKELLDTSLPGTRAFQRGYQRLEQLASAALPDRRYLVHGDLLNDNVLVSGNAVSAVLDWGNAIYGDFLYDLAWFQFWSPWYPAWSRVDFVAEARRHYDAIGLAVPDFERRLTACLLHIGLDGLAYSAFKERWDDVDTISRRTLEFAALSP